MPIPIIQDDDAHVAQQESLTSINISTEQGLPTPWTVYNLQDHAVHVTANACTPPTWLLSKYDVANSFLQAQEWATAPTSHMQCHHWWHHWTTTWILAPNWTNIIWLAQGVCDIVETNTIKYQQPSSLTMRLHMYFSKKKSYQRHPNLWTWDLIGWNVSMLNHNSTSNGKQEKKT